MYTELSETQKSILIAAAQHPEHRLDWFPEGIRGGARAKVLGSLQGKGLIEHRDDCYVITTAGLAALGLPETPTEPTDGINLAPSQDFTPDAPKANKIRENTKQAMVIALLKRPEGATLKQLVEATGWKRHTARAALSILGKKQRLPIESSKTESGRVYRIGASPKA